MEVEMAYRDYEFDRDYGNRGNWRGRGEYDRDRWYGGGYGAGGYGDWDRGWNRSSSGGWGTGATNPDYTYGGSYGRGEPWYGGGSGSQGMERGYGNQNFERGYGYGGAERGYPGYGGYGGYGGGYGSNAGEWRGGSSMGYESGASRYQGRQNQGNWQQQNYSGRGPRNYQRSDDRIEEDVNEALTRHPGLDASEIEVRVQNGEVTLTGTVDSRQDKRMAEDAAESCPGVRDVHNQLRVSSTGSRNTEREVTRTPTQEGRTSGESRGESRGGSRQTASSRSSK
jgi:hypothetical protein